MADAVATSDSTSIIGGGDSVKAINSSNLLTEFFYEYHWWCFP